jgi:hypothetical protein
MQPSDDLRNDSRLEQPWPGEAAPDDRWFFRPDGELPGDAGCLLAIEQRDGTQHCTYSVLEWLDELKASSPAQFLRLRLAMAAEALGPDVRN